MRELLAALRFRPTVSARVALTALFVLTPVVTALGVRSVFSATDPAVVLAVHIASWGCWFYWQGVIFPAHRTKVLLSHPTSAYARAFCSQILPGVCAGLMQMTRPVVEAVGGMTFRPNSLILLPSLGIACAGLVLLLAGFRQLGIARAGFLHEYRTTDRVIITRGVFSIIRHPLFIGGVLVSVGATLSISAHPRGGLLALCNMLVIPVYARVEDRRLLKVFGVSYASYMASVGGIFPRVSVLSALLRGVERSTERKRALE